MPNTEPVRVLVVDDFPSWADRLVSILNRQGCSARAAYSGSEALCLAEQHHPHVLVTDVCMPEMNGIELAETLTARFPSCRVLLITGNHDFDLDPDDPRRYGLLPKPVPIDELNRFIAMSVPA